MKNVILTLLALALANNAFCIEFDQLFLNETLRVDASICGDGHNSTVQIDSISQWQGWYGRRVNLDTLLYPGEMKVSVIDVASRDTIFVDALSPNSAEYPGDCTLATFLVPKPKNACEISVGLYGGDEASSNKFGLLKSCSVALSCDSLNNVNQYKGGTKPYITLRQAADPLSSINLAIMSEGYTICEKDSFVSKAKQIESAIFSQPGFKENADKFNVIAVFIPSAESGASMPNDSIWLDTNFKSKFDSYGYARLLIVPDTRLIWNAMAGLPATEVIILANTSRYGGSGTYGDYAIASANIANCNEIIIHEFGHSFGWLGDEYEDGYDITYTSDFEPFEPNITTLHDFRKKWINLIESGEAGFIEGGGYQSKGVWRGCEHCLMRSLSDVYFCPVCAQAITRLIEYKTSPSTSR